MPCAGVERTDLFTEGTGILHLGHDAHLLVQLRGGAKSDPQLVVDVVMQIFIEALVVEFAPFAELARELHGLRKQYGSGQQEQNNEGWIRFHAESPVWWMRWSIYCISVPVSSSCSCQRVFSIFCPGRSLCRAVSSCGALP